MSAPATYSSREVEKVLHIKPATLRKWVERGHVRKLARDRYVLQDIFDHCRLLSEEAG